MYYEAFKIYSRDLWNFLSISRMKFECLISYVLEISLVYVLSAVERITFWHRVTVERITFWHRITVERITFWHRATVERITFDIV